MLHVYAGDIGELAIAMQLIYASKKKNFFPFFFFLKFNTRVQDIPLARPWAERPRARPNASNLELP